MSTHVERRTVDLSGYPDLVVIYLGMCVNRITGMKTLLGSRPKITASASALPDGLLRHEMFVFSLFPMHVGMRQYWRDMDSLMKWTRSEPHRQWWQQFLERLEGHRVLARDLYAARRHRSDPPAMCRSRSGSRPSRRRFQRAGRCLERPREPENISQVIR